MQNYIDRTAIYGRSTIFGQYVVVESDVRIGRRVTIGNHVTICAETIIDDDVTIADFAVVGRKPRLSPRSTAKKGELPPLVVGRGSYIGSHTVLMAGSTIGRRCIIGDNAGVRERCHLSDDVVVGRSVSVENDTVIGARTKVQTGSYITAYVTIEEDVFVAPMVVTTNDNFMGRTETRLALMKGCTIRRGARIGGGVHILPGIEIGEEAFIGTGAVVTKNVPAYELWFGNPARRRKEVPAEELLDPKEE
jgi:acetyltransferase-like isoleucine patch superfamily enzyme